MYHHRADGSKGYQCVVAGPGTPERNKACAHPHFICGVGEGAAYHRHNASGTLVSMWRVRGRPHLAGSMKACGKGWGVADMVLGGCAGWGHMAEEFLLRSPGSVVP